MDLSKIRPDKERVANGVWLQYKDGARLKIASSDSPEFRRDFSERTAPYSSTGSEVPSDVMEEITLSTLSKHILVDWEGITDGDEAYPYSVENAKRLLSEVPEVLAWVVAQAAKRAHFRAKFVTATSKN